MKDPPRVSSLWGDPSQGTARPLVRMQQQEVYSDTQVPGATESLGGLARPQVGVMGLYMFWGAKSAVQKREA